MACRCVECKHARETENLDWALCDNWESDNYGSEMDREERCEFGEVDLVKNALEGEK